MTRKKIGLALGSGGARGLAHVGVIKKLVEEKIPIDFVAGSSIGALVGGVYARFGNVDILEKEFENFDWKDWFGTFSDPGGVDGLIKGGKGEAWLRAMVDDIKIEDLKVPFCAVATNLDSGEVEVIKKGGLVEAVRASCSVPGLFQPYKSGEENLVDGGLSYPVPVEIVKEMGAEKVIAVDLDGIYFKNKNRKDKNERRNVVVNLLDSLKVIRHHLAEKETREADVVLVPEGNYVNGLNFVHQKGLIESGYQTAEKEIEKIKKLIS